VGLLTLLQYVIILNIESYIMILVVAYVCYRCLDTVG